MPILPVESKDPRFVDEVVDSKDPRLDVKFGMGNFDWDLAVKAVDDDAAGLLPLMLSLSFKDSRRDRLLK